MTPHPAVHGWDDFAIAYGLTLLGMMVGLRFARAGAAQFKRAPLLALPMTLIGALLWGLMHQALLVNLGAQSFVATSVLAALSLLAFGALGCSDTARATLGGPQAWRGHPRRSSRAPISAARGPGARRPAGRAAG